MGWLYIACLSGFMLGISALNAAPQGSITTISDVSTSLNLFEPLSASREPVSWSNGTLTPASAPSLPANMSALQAIGLDANEPIIWETTPSGNVLGVQCHIRYGRRLDLLDCRDSYIYIPRSDERVLRFAQRGSEFPHEISLPQRILGSISSLTYHFLYPLIASACRPRPQMLIVKTGKGKCGISPILIDPYDTAMASPKNLAEAAYALIDRCPPRSGGLAINIGGDNHLAVLLEPYASTVGCEDAVVPITRQSCATIERGMEADERPRVFGDETLDPEVEEHLPYELISSDNKCSVQIMSNAGIDVETWYHLWEANVALNAKCVRAGKRGTATHLGLRGRLYMTISDQPSLSPVGVGNGTAAHKI